MRKIYEDEKWEKLLSDIEKHRGRKRLKKFGKGISFVILGLLFINFSVGVLFTSPTEALRSVVLDISREEDGHYVQYSWLSDEKLDEMELELEDEDVFLPEYLPPGYKLDEFEISTDEGDYYANIRFTDDNDTILRLTQRKIPKNGQSTRAFPNAEETDDIEISGNEGIIVHHESDTIVVFFIDHRGIEHVLTGKVSEEEMINIAESIH